MQSVEPEGQTQRPAVQVDPPPQRVPQAPHEKFEVWRSTQNPPQLVVPVLHAHAPIVQVAVVPQVRPHAPQLLLLVWRLAQNPPQLVCPVGQVFEQVPALQT